MLPNMGWAQATCHTGPSWLHRQSGHVYFTCREEENDATDRYRRAEDTNRAQLQNRELEDGSGVLPSQIRHQYLATVPDIKDLDGAVGGTGGEARPVIIHLGIVLKERPSGALGTCLWYNPATKEGINGLF